MIDKGKLEAYLNEILTFEGCFLVDLSIDRNNRIVVYADREDGISIEDCARISRSLESKLDRDSEDFSLEVSSPGLNAPFRVIEQYYRSKGRKVKVVTKDGRKLEGLLEDINDSGISILTGDGRILKISFPEIQSARRDIPI